MQQLLISTTGVNVTLNDLGGLQLVNPVANYDLINTAGLDIESLRDSVDLQDALTGGTLTAIDENALAVTNLKGHFQTVTSVEKSNAANAIPDAPNDVNSYVRKAAAWLNALSAVSNNAGQIKLNWTALTRPQSPAGFSAGVPQAIGLNSNYTVSAFPTTTYPYLANDLIGGQNVIDTTTQYLRELLAGQTIIFRVKVGYANKGAGQNGNIVIRMFNPNPGSSFTVPKSLPTPDGTTAYEEEFEFIAIADSLSLDPLYGYTFESETTFNDGNLVVYINEITAFYQAKDLINKT